MSIAFSILKLNELKTLSTFLLISPIFGEYASFTNETCLKASADKLYLLLCTGAWNLTLPETNRSLKNKFAILLAFWNKFNKYILRFQ